jgi:Fur family transcriptional regulator, ferric uptake regulator
MSLKHWLSETTSTRLSHQVHMKSSLSESPVEKRELRKAGLKLTLPRMKVREILETTRAEDQHLSADDIYRLLIETGEDIGLATVYRMLGQLEAAGLVTRHHFEGGQAVFELDRGDHHDHVVCVRCGHVAEFVSATIASEQRRTAENAGFRITAHAVIIYSVCRRCTREGKAQLPRLRRSHV